ncbi:hypothetical protein [Falsirhodobacter sp. alg1]|uniref:hypothetical protein n=1 Tax=Falsirhodobacter sp. alg1 TaxID=1472418 RepID=UPI0005EF62E9|nr:hypothetical protein [Falsirhodobacter sp. alg1]
MARGKITRRGSSRGSRRGASSGGGASTSLLALGALAVVAALGGAFWWSSKDAATNAIDPQTLCPTPAGPVGMTAILLDLTDPLSPAQHSQLMAWLEDEIDRAPRGTQFTMGVVSQDRAKWGATDPLCKPQDATSANSLTQNARLIDTRYRDRFLDPLKTRLEGMVSASGADRSPIMESLQALVSDSAGFVTFDGPRRIVVVSDLLQHSDVLSFYRGGDWDSFRSSPDYQRIGTTLDGTEVQIYQVPRPTEGVKDPAVLEDFWMNYFERQGSHIPSVKRLGDL